MTPPSAKHMTDEQRIAALEVQLVRLSGALEDAHEAIKRWNDVPRTAIYDSRLSEMKRICSALASTAEFEGKVVVDRELLDRVRADLICGRETTTLYSAHRWIRTAYARLYAIRNARGKG